MLLDTIFSIFIETEKPELIYIIVITVIVILLLRK